MFNVLVFTGSFLLLHHGEIPQNALRTGVNTRTPTRKFERLCPPVPRRCNYPALIANTNISPRSNFPLEDMNTAHKPFYWHREADGAVRMGRGRRTGEPRRRLSEMRAGTEKNGFFF